MKAYHMTLASRVSSVRRDRMYLDMGIGAAWVVPFSQCDHCTYFGELLRCFPSNDEKWSGSRITLGLVPVEHKGVALSPFRFDFHETCSLRHTHIIFPVCEAEVYLINFREPDSGRIWLPSSDGSGLDIVEDLPDNVVPLHR